MTSLLTHRIFAGSFPRASALCLLALAAGLLLPGEARAQWTTPNAQGDTNTTGTGNVGIGTTAPAAILDAQRTDATDLLMRVWNTGTAAGSTTTFRIANSSNTASRLQFTDQSSYVSTISAERTGGLRFRTGNAATEATLFDRMTIAPNGNVGVGTAAPSYRFEVFGAPSRNTLALTGDGDSVGYSGIKIQAFTTTGIASNRSSQFNLHMRKDAWYGGDGSGPSFIIETVSKAGGYAAPVLITPTNDVILNGGKGASGLAYGNVGIGTTAPAAKLHVAGDIRVDGNINAKYQDVAEWVPSTQKLAPGTVVVLDTGRDNHVAASLSSYDTRVAGVVSAQPGISLGEAGEGKALVATTGRVKVRVDATQGPVKVGDLLVTSDREGYAMKSEAVLIGKRQFHSPGTIIGKALESLAGGAGEILVLLSLQ